MPDLDEHCKHCLERYGVDGKEIHQWMDEPVKLVGVQHRQFRHDPITTPQEAQEVFKGKYSEKRIENIVIDHIMLDREETIRTHNGKDVVDTANEKAAKEEKEMSLPQITSEEIKDYLNMKFAGEDPNYKYLGTVSLRHWQRYLNSRDKPNRDVSSYDVLRFISQLNKNVKEASAKENYLGQLVPFFRVAYNDKLAEEILKAKKNFAKEASSKQKNKLPIRVDDFKTFYRKAKEIDRIVIRLLVLEPIDINDFDKIFFDGEKYQFHNGDDIIKIDPDTVQTAKKYLEISGDKSRIVRFGDRQLDDRFCDLSERTNIKITPRDLKRFRKNQHPEDIRKWLSEAIT